MPSLVPVLQGITAFCFIGLAVLALPWLLVKHGELVTWPRLREFLGADAGDPSHGRVPALVERPPAWLRTPAWIAQRLEFPSWKYMSNLGTPAVERSISGSSCFHNANGAQWLTSPTVALPQEASRSVQVWPVPPK